jgi:hypothetical protein
VTATVAAVSRSATHSFSKRNDRCIHLIAGHGVAWVLARDANMLATVSPDDE